MLPHLCRKQHYLSEFSFVSLFEFHQMAFPLLFYIHSAAFYWWPLTIEFLTHPTPGIRMDNCPAQKFIIPHK